MRLTATMVAAVVVLLSGVVAAVRMASDEGRRSSPTATATASVDAMLAGDCARWLALATKSSREFISAAGGCPLTGPVPGEVREATVRERQGNAAIVLVDVDRGPLADERVEVLVAREAEGAAWLVDLTAAVACASPEGEAPSDEDCEPMSIGRE